MSRDLTVPIVTGFLSMLTVVGIILKVTGIIDLSWLVILLPVLLPCLAILAVAAFCWLVWAVRR